MPGQQHILEFRFLAEPADVNFGGKVHGGAVLKWIDQAAYACAVAWSGKYCVTAAMGGIQFLASILIGDLVQVRCRIVQTGRSSMTLIVDVRARDLKAAHDRLATQCVLTFVALDAPDGKPTPVPRWTPVTAEDVALARYAERVMQVHRQLDSTTVPDCPDVIPAPGG
jgi:acyl-CoA hydrolase